MQPSEGYVTAEDGVRLFFRKLGDGSKAVIIPNAVHMFDSFHQLTGDRTLVFFDLRNRGASDSVSDSSKLIRGVHHDADDIDAVRRHFGFTQVDLIGHSYLGFVVILYGLKYPAHVNRIVQLGPVQPHAATQYPAHLTGADATLAEFLGKIAQLQKEGPPQDPKEACRKFWAMLRVLQVANPADAEKIRWSPCDSPNELSFMRHWTQNLLPSVQSLDLRAEASKVRAPVLIVHGKKDRQAPYGGGREWALLLPDARLVTVENAAHVPWIEAPKKVFGAIETFLNGAWPEAASRVESLESGNESAPAG